MFCFDYFIWFYFFDWFIFYFSLSLNFLFLPFNFSIYHQIPANIHNQWNQFEFVIYPKYPKHTHKTNKKTKIPTTENLNENEHTQKIKRTTKQLFETDIGPLKRSLSAKSRRFSRISEIALVTNCFWAKTCYKKRVNVSYNCHCVCYVLIFVF